MARSRGTIAALVTVSAFAPVYSTVTFTSGGAMLGKSAIGNWNNDSIPRNTITSDMTIANIGR
jgi:hypothetical protein